MYYIAILVDGRKYHTVPLRPINGSNIGKPIPSFVLEREPGQSRSLFSIVHQAPLVHHGGYDNDRLIDWQSPRVEHTDTELHLHMAALPAGELFREGGLPADSDESIRHEGGRFGVSVARQYAPTSLTVTLTVTIGEAIYEGNLLFQLVPKTQIYDVVMDFGSEASQIVVHRRSGDGQFTRMKMVDNLLRYYYANLKGKALHQRTDEDDELYRSAFFIKKEGSVFLPTESPGKAGNKELLNLLTDKTEVNLLTAERELVSNLKLAHLGAYNFEVHFENPASNVFGVWQQNFLKAIVPLQQAVVHYFLQTVLKQIRLSTPEGTPVYLIVKLLMPNVFEQNKVAEMINGTATGLQHIVAADNSQLRGFEVSTISESDAAFLGFKHEQHRLHHQGWSNLLQLNKRYLIIDVGKGTTDFSILKVDANGRVLSLYRAGFIGAGNVLSYAFIDSVFASICGENTEARQRAIHTVMQRVGVAGRLRFTEQIERLKRDYKSNGNYKPLRELTELNSLKRLIDANDVSTLDTITERLEQVCTEQGSIQDEWGIIQRTVEDTANRIFGEVVQSGQFADRKTGDVLIDKVILTGRGFLFDPFRKAVADRFGEFGIQTVKASEQQELKKVCLKGAFSRDHINHESNLVGYPDTYELFGSEESKIMQQQAQKKEQATAKPWKQKFLQYKKTLQAWTKDFDSQWTMPTDSVLEDQSIGKAQVSDEEDFLLRGKQLENFNRHAQTITVCGLDYRYSEINSPSVNVFYTGETFLVRDRQKCSLLEIEPDFFKKTQWVFKTLFPFMETTSPSEIQVAHLDKDSF